LADSGAPQPLDVLLDVRRLLYIEQSLARERAREPRLASHQRSNCRGQLRRPLQISQRRNPMSERPVVTVRHASRLRSPLRRRLELARQQMRERTIRITRPPLRIVRTELNRALEARHRFAKAAVVRQ